MKHKFRNNSIYLFLFRTIILLVDLIGLNAILYAIQQIWRPTFLTQDPSGNLTYLLVIFNVTWILLSYFLKTYQRNFQLSYNLKASLILFIVHVLINLGSLLYFDVKIVDPAVVTLYAILGLFFIPISRLSTKHYLIKIDSFLHLRKRVALIGNGSLYDGVFTFLNSEDSGFKLVEGIPNLNRNFGSINYFEKCIQFAHKNSIKEIFSVILPEDEKMYKKILAECEKKFIRIRFINRHSNFKRGNIIIRNESEIPFIVQNREPLEDLDNRLRKRLFDLLVGLLVIIFFLSWMFPLIALLIKLDSKGPIIFKQLRSGRKNQPFYCLKFRTMVPNQEKDLVQAVKNDSRFTRIGKFLRKTNLDELPQFINVLFGQMSIIGPRPHMLSHTEEYSNTVESYMQRHFIKPGISGWAQVNGLRGDLNQEKMEIRVKYDLHYLYNWNIWVDFEILLKTIEVTVLGDENAY